MTAMSQGARRRQAGASQVEATIVFAIGIMVVLAGALVGYYMLRNRLIQARLQQQAAAFKTIVDTSMARASFPKWNKRSDWEGFFRMVPEARTNPYTGTPRRWSWDGGEGAFYAVKIESVTVTSENNNPLGKQNILGGFAYLWNDDRSVQNNLYTIVFDKDETQRYFGWVFYATDMSGNIVAAVGGLPVKDSAADGYRAAWSKMGSG